MKEPIKPKGTVVTGVIGDDVHIVGVRILEYALGQAGFKVVPLGSQISQNEFVDSAIETNADAIFISSLSGHADGLMPGLREKCLEAGRGEILVYLGGYLSVGKTPWEDIEDKFRNMGIDRVYPPGTSPTQAIEDLEKDIAKRGSN